MGREKEKGNEERTLSSLSIRLYSSSSFPGYLGEGGGEKTFSGFS
jgi:hypothetical protein